MSTTKNVTIKQFNGEDYDIVNPATSASQISGTLSDSQISSASTWNEKQNKITASGLLKGNGSGSISAASASDIPDLPASKITSGTFADARIASASTWNAKQAALVSGTNIKTINNNSILGSGNLSISGTVGATATLTSSGWTQQSSGAYAQSVSITGKNLTSASNVMVDCALSMSDLDADVEVLTAWGCVNNAVAGTDTLTFYCYATAPTVAIPISVVISG